MTSFWSGGGAALLGGGLSALGGLLGAGGDTTEQHKARDVYDNRTGTAAQRLGTPFYGGSYMDLVNLSNGWLPQSERDAAQKRFLDSIGGSILSQYRGLQSQGQTQGQAMLRDYDRNTGLLDAQGARLQGLAGQYGRGADSLIDQTADRSAREAQRSIASQSAARGLGNSTLGVNQAAGTVADIRRGATGQKLSIQGENLDRVLGAGTNRVNTMAGRLGGRTQLQGQNLERNLQLGQVPLQAMTGLQTSGTMNPWLGQSGQAFIPQYSGTGTALSTIGNAFGQYGGQQQILDLLKKMGGRSGGVDTFPYGS